MIPPSFFIASSRGKNMFAEILSLAPVVCVVLALGALFYFTRTP